MAVAGQGRGVEERLDRLVRQMDPFQVEEDQMLVDGDGLLLGPGEEGAALRVVAFGGVAEAGVDQRLVALLRQALQLVQGGGEQIGGGAAGDVDFAAVCRLERFGALERGLQILVDPRVVQAGIQVAEVPRHAIGAAGRRRRRRVR